VIPDAIAILIAGYIALSSRFGGSRVNITDTGIFDLTYLSLVVMAGALWFLVLLLSGNYRFRHEILIVTDPKSIIGLSFRYFLILGFVSFILKASFSRSVFLILLFSGLLSIGIVRLFMQTLVIKPKLRKGKLYSNLVVIGSSEADLAKYCEWVKQNRELGFKIKVQIVCSEITLSWLENFDKELGSANASEILILPGLESDPSFSKFIHYLEDLNTHVDWIPLDSGNLGYWLSPQAQDGLPFLTFSEAGINSMQSIAKRAFDILFSSLVLVVISPILLLISLITVITSGFPIMYISNRIGKDGVSFKFLKFRTMVKGADAMVGEVENVHGSDHVLFKNKHDPRVTPFGRIMRKYSLDELPQFWNVLMGQMSVVGPRPALDREVQVYNSLYERRLKAKPGITGPWQISGRSDLDLQTSISLDLNYLTNWSFTNDIAIIIATVGAVLKGRGAY
jgi:exopolysaccharide biosynthesis polyprenyl glycosylphosphotransferase